jgi:hypothetical protein
MAAFLRDSKTEATARAAKLEGELRAELRKKLYLDLRFRWGIVSFLIKAVLCRATLPQEPPTSNLSAATTLLEKRREMFEVQAALDAQKKEYTRFEDIMKRREDELETRDLKLQDHLLKFNKHLQVWSFSCIFRQVLFTFGSGARAQKNKVREEGTRRAKDQGSERDRVPYRQEAAVRSGRDQGSAAADTGRRCVACAIVAACWV